ncbi:M23 family metallopeptidase [Streptomyces sp. NRRL B-1677]|uniref:M23 family metallopeptidase n=1 Tax=Streptomyces sp. NRRL B-1677 TaxID=2682966 RepID=UPI002B4B4896|nr:M23 family metallopeptidase [Streptomyces sp. NRRL B-1677]
MASNEPAAYGPDAAYEHDSYDPPLVPAYAPPYVPEPEPEPQSYGPESSYEPERSYDPSAFSAFSFGAGRGRHRVVKQRGGTMARSGAVLGVGVIAAVGAGGMASAQERPAASISMPDLAQLPGVGSFFAGSAAGTASADSLGEETGSGTAASEMAQDAARAGEALRARILEQADHQQTAADAEAQAARVTVAAAEQKQAAEHKAAEAEAARTAAAAAAEQKQAEQGRATSAQSPQSPESPERTQERPRARTPERKQPEKRERSGGAPAPVRHSGALTLPVGSYTLTAGFGQAGNMWSAHHTGEDFAAPTGTPVKAVGGGTITQAGWAGAYGYRIVLRLDDGTELWFCHLSSMVVTSGKVAAGQVIGRVGATGNVTGPHLHLEVRPGGGAPVDPLGWLRGRGLRP